MKEKKETSSTIGKVEFINFDEYLAWLSTKEAEEYFSIPNLWSKCLHELQGKIPGVSVSDLFDACKPYTLTHSYKESLVKMKYYIDRFSNQENELHFNLVYEHEKFDIIKFGGNQFLIPSGRLLKDYYKDYSDIPMDQIKQSTVALNSSSVSMVPSGNELAFRSISEQKSLLESELIKIKDIESDMYDVKNAKVEGLSELQAEIDRIKQELEAKKEALMKELRVKMDEMEAKKQQLENQLFVLESEIYSIRCYLGEVVDFIKIRSGKDAPADNPIILYQKIRFLDEELGKAISLYDFDFSDIKMFEDFLKNRDDALDVFCPSERCVALVRVSRTGTAWGLREVPYGLILKEYEVYHGKTIGILIRNGENLYMGWTDDDRIGIPDDMFFTPGEKQVDPEDADKQEVTSIKEMVSRVFVFSILQGALDNKKMLELPEGVKASFTKPSEYIVYSAADRWLADNRYGTFDDMVERCNATIKVGDQILAIEDLWDGHSNSWNHYPQYNRDHNYSRRTHDVRYKDGEIYKIALVENDEFYVSLEKDGPDYIYYDGDYHKRKRVATALFQVYPSEFINITYMNSAWLKYVITTRNLGNYGRLGHYAETIRYLNKALEVIKKREKVEQALIEQYIPRLADDREWPAKLSEWKLEKGVRTITNYQAKRFSKHLMENR